MKTKKPARSSVAAGAPRPETGAAPHASPSGLEPARRWPLLIALAWLGTIVLGVLLSGCPRFDALYAVFLGTSLLIIVGELLFLDALYRKGKLRLYLGWKKFTGYALPIYYFVHALPRVAWQNAGLIGDGRGTFIFFLTALSTVVGSFLFFVQGRPRSLAAFEVISEEEVEDRVLRKRRAKEHRKRGFLAGLLEWVDSLAWAAIAVLIVNIFVFQLYVVPSESMVPAFLVGDRPFTLKAAAGPRIPLTEWRLPFLRLPQRGDIITIANPRYPENHRVDLKKYVSQLVYMITLTGVNLDATLPDGTPKADPLVKRVVGVPGEKLMMVDDRLYARKKGEAEFHPVEEPWARVDLWKESAELRAKIESMPIDQATRELLRAWDERKAAADPRALGEDVSRTLARIEASLDRLSPSLLAGFAARELPRADSSLKSRRDEAIAAAERGENPYRGGGATAEDFSLALAAAGSPRAREALRSYAAGAIAASAVPGANAYERGSRVLNLIVKLNLLGRIDRDLALLADGGRIEAFGADAPRARLVAEARELYLYLQGFYDTRNFPEFPAGEAFLAHDEYFAMGDNRYNSLDFRYTTTQSSRLLDPADPASVTYLSMLEPFPLKLRFIEGYALFRLWPPSRLGAIR